MQLLASRPGPDNCGVNADLNTNFLRGASLIPDVNPGDVKALTLKFWKTCFWWGAQPCKSRVAAFGGFSRRSTGTCS